MSEQEPTRGRKPKARQRDIIWGALDERLDILDSDLATNGASDRHVARIRELLDELRRSLKGDE